MEMDEKIDLERCTEALICNSQEQSIRTMSSAILTKLVSHPFVEFVIQEMRLLSECGKHAQKEYKWRHDSVGRYVH